jgi:hypothetical protein
VKLSRFRKAKVPCFLSYVEDRFKCKYKHYYVAYKCTQNMFPKVGLLKETNGGEREEKNDRE